MHQMPTESPLERGRYAMLELGRWAAVAALFFVPINKPATNICMALVVLASLLGPQLRQRWTHAWQHPVARGALLWWATLAFSALYAPQSGELWRSWFGFIALAYPILVMSLTGHDERWLRRACWAFGLAIGLVLLISLLKFAGIMPQRKDGMFPGQPWYNTAFKEYTQQGLAVLTLAVLLFALLLQRRQGSGMWALWVGIAACLASILFVTQSRTSLAIIVPLAMLWCVWLWRCGTWGRRWVMAMVLIGALGAAFAWSLAQHQQSRLSKIQEELSLYQSKPLAYTSIGTRLELWQQTLKLIPAAPVLGLGLDQWYPHFLEQTKDKKDYELFRKRFPHMDYLQIMAEQGALGLLVFLGLLVALARYVSQLAAPYRHFFAGLLLIYLMAALFNSLLVDFTHRHLFLLWLAFIPLAPAREQA